MATFYKRGKTFTVAFRLKGLPRQYIHGIRTEKLALRAKLKKDEEEQLVRAGLLRPDADEDQLRRSSSILLPQHVKNFGQNILDRNKSSMYAKQQESLVRRLLFNARILTIHAIRIDSVQRALKKLHVQGRGPRTINSARQAVIQFERYLHRIGAIRRTVLRNLQRFNELEDVRRMRRPLSQEEVDLLLRFLEGIDKSSTRCGISSTDRAMLYSTAIGTGFRQRALLSLEKSSFRLFDGQNSPCVSLSAKFNKNRKDRDQPIPADLADRLRGWLLGKPSSGPVWRPTPHANLSLRFRRDMEFARAAWISEGKDAQERNQREASSILKYVHHDGRRNIFADFHSLRHTAITFAVRSAGLRAAQEWADHSSPNLTAKYAAVDERDLLKVVHGLPSLNPNRPQNSPI